MSFNLDVVTLPHFEGLDLPCYMTHHASGMDMAAAITEPVVLAPMDIKLIPTGLMIAVPPGYEAQIRPRSGLALKYGITLPNAPGTIDADYRGEISIIVQNLGKNSFTIHRGDRIAQLVIAPVISVEWNVVTNLQSTLRDNGGFGHTGI